MNATLEKAPDLFLRALAEGDCEEVAERLNRGCQCVSLDHERLRAELERDPRDGALLAMIAATRPHLFADSVAFGQWVGAYAPNSKAHQEMTSLTLRVKRILGKSSRP